MFSAAPRQRPAAAELQQPAARGAAQEKQISAAGASAVPAASHKQPFFELAGPSGPSIAGADVTPQPAATLTPLSEGPAEEAVATADAPGVAQGVRRLSGGPRVSRPHWTHPGYFSEPSGPKYTPAGPEALADRRESAAVHGAGVCQLACCVWLKCSSLCCAVLCPTPHYSFAKLRCRLPALA